jgi:hypothetical protein
MKKIDNILVLVSILTLAMIASASTLKTASATGYAGPYYDIESATNSSTFTMGPASAVGQTFTATIKLYNVTKTDVPAGIAGVEVHMSWNNTLIAPTSFVNEIAQPGGALTGNILYTINPGFFDAAGNSIATAPYTNATQFEVAAASTAAGGWWGDGAEIAVITFQVNLQPQPFGTCPLVFSFTDLVDTNAASVTHDAVNATYTILTPNPETVAFQGVNYQVSIVTDSQITAPANLGFENYTNGSASMTFNVTSSDGFCNVTVPNNFMYSIPTSAWTITVDGSAPQSQSITSDSVNAYLWFNWSGAGNHVIMLTSTNSVPEFAATGLLLFLMATTLIVITAATVLRRRKLYR